VVLFGMQNRILPSYLAAMNRILISTERSRVCRAADAGDYGHFGGGPWVADQREMELKDLVETPPPQQTEYAGNPTGASAAFLRPTVGMRAPSPGAVISNASRSGSCMMLRRCWRCHGSGRSAREQHAPVDACQCPFPEGPDSLLSRARRKDGGGGV
jgi:hypothetical protein